MAAYIVFTRESTRDVSELKTYAQKVGSTLAGHPITVLSAAPPSGAPSKEVVTVKVLSPSKTDLDGTVWTQDYLPWQNPWDSTKKGSGGDVR